MLVRRVNRRKCAFLSKNYVPHNNLQLASFSPTNISHHPIGKKKVPGDLLKVIMGYVHNNKPPLDEK